MAFPTIPTVAAGRVLSVLSTDTSGGTVTSPNLSSLTKNSGDLLIAICIVYDGNSTNAEFSSWGGSFTEFVDQATTTTMGIGAAYKWSDGTETGTFTVAVAGGAAGSDAAFFLLSIPGAHATTPPEGGTIANGTAAAADPGSLSPAGWGTEDTLWIAVAGSGETSTTGSYTGVASAPANYTDYADSGISADAVGGVEGAVAFRQLNAASEDVGTFSVDVSNARNSALLIAVRPAAPAYSGSYSHVGTASMTLTVQLGTKAYSHVGSLVTTKSLLFQVSKAFSHVGSLVASSDLIYAASKAYSHVASAAKRLTVNLGAKSYSHVGTAAESKTVSPTAKAYGHTGAAASTETLQIGVSKSYSHVGSLVQSRMLQAIKSLAYSAVHVLATTTQFIAGGGDPPAQGDHGRQRWRQIGLRSRR